MMIKKPEKEYPEVIEYVCGYNQAISEYNAFIESIIEELPEIMQKAKEAWTCQAPAIMSQHPITLDNFYKEAIARELRQNNGQ